MQEKQGRTWKALYKTVENGNKGKVKKKQTCGQTPFTCPEDQPNS
jgi:hypothetical protein